MDEVVKEIYKNLQDEESRFIFQKRLGYSSTGKYAYILEMLSGLGYIPDFNDLNKVPCYIFGAGYYGRLVKSSWMAGINFSGFIDNNPKLQGTLLEGMPVYSFDSLCGQDMIVFIASKDHSSEIKKQLIEAGIDVKSIISVCEIVECLTNAQYFDLPYLKWQQNEIFVDCGAYNGINAKNFFRVCPKEKEPVVYSFEPIREFYEKTEETLKDEIAVGRAFVINKGCYKENGKTLFKKDGWSSAMSTDGDCPVELVSLDLFFKKNKVTYIKMDIEGAEMDAIRGAKNIIIRDRPKLAICVYHRSSDIIDIPQCLLELHQDYKFYLRHYSLHKTETVLYAL